MHFTGFYPIYKLTDIPATSIESLKKARQIALDAGLRYVYTGNLENQDGETTFCEKCGKEIIKRRMFSVTENNLNLENCKFCNEKVPGVFS